MKTRRVLRHIIFWSVWLFGMSFFYGMNPRGLDFGRSFSQLASGMPVYLMYSYLILYWALPRTLLKRKVFLFSLLLIVASFAFSVVLRLHTKFIFFRFFAVARSMEVEMWDWLMIMTNMLWLNIPMVMFATVKFFYNYSLEESRRKELEKQNLQAELSLLNIQLKPHFLFNTLNNLYSMALTGDERTASSLDKIINLLNYILLEYNEATVKLEKEISLIRNYADLERIRYQDNLDFSLEIDQKAPGVFIAPMILFTFIENSFKHGSSPASGKSYIHVKIQSEPGNIFFECLNSYPGHSAKKCGQGLGLENVKKRLELYYQNRHNLQIKKRKGMFSVKLELNTGNEK